MIPFGCTSFPILIPKTGLSDPLAGSQEGVTVTDTGMCLGYFATSQLGQQRSGNVCERLAWPQAGGTGFQYGNKYHQGPRAIG